MLPCGCSSRRPAVARLLSACCFQERYRRLHKTPVFSHEGLVCTYCRVVAKDTRESPDAAAVMLPIITALSAGLAQRIQAATDAGISNHGQFPTLVQVVSEAEAGSKMKMAAASGKMMAAAPHAPTGKMQAGGSATVPLTASEVEVVPAPAVAMTRMLGSKSSDTDGSAGKGATPAALMAALRRWNREKSRGKKGASSFVVEHDDADEIVVESETGPGADGPVTTGKHTERARVSTIDEANPLKGARCLECQQVRDACCMKTGVHFDHCCFALQYCYLGMITCDSCDVELGLKVDSTDDADNVRPLLLTRCVCLYHATSSMGCSHPLSNRRMRIRFSNDELQDLIDAVAARAAGPLRWREKAAMLARTAQPLRKQAVDDPPRPTERKVQSLLRKANAMRIPHAESSFLSSAVAACASWDNRALHVMPRRHNTRKIRVSA